MEQANPQPEETQDQPKEESKEDSKIEKIRRVKEEEERLLASLKDYKYEALVSDCYTEMDSYVDMVAEGISHGCIIGGSGGIGKTYRAMNRCLKTEMAYTDSFSTPAAFYVWMYKNRDKQVLIADDVAGMLNNPKVLAFLKGALWEVNGKRIVHYMSTKPLQDEEGNYVESSFEAKFGMVIITNHLNKKNAHLQAVLSRVNYCEVEVPREELFRILGQVVEKEYPGLDLRERTECLNFLKGETSESTRNLNIRTLFKLFQFREYAKSKDKGDFWKVLGKKMFSYDDIEVLVEALENDEDLSVHEKEEKFNKLTGKSRATYHRIKQKMKG